MKFKSASFAILFLYSLVIAQDTFEPSFAYDFGFIATARYQPLNSTTLQRAFRNKNAAALEHYKQQLFAMNTQDQYAILANIDFTNLKNALIPELQVIQRDSNNLSEFNLMSIVFCISSGCLLLQKAQKKSFPLVHINQNILDLYRDPSTWFFVGSMLYFMYFNYRYQPMVITMQYLHNFEVHYRSLTNT